MQTTIVSMPVPPLLSICVPTYNRADKVAALIQSICDHMLESDAYSIELVVSNNASTDGTAEILAKFLSYGVKVINRAEHLESAEENMIYSIDHASGEFIWFVGDDDIINFYTFNRVYETLKNGIFDCLIHNSPILTHSGRVRSLGPIKMSAEYVEGTVQQIIESIGLLYTFAGITNIIQRREILKSDRGHFWLNVSMIYSHVAWIAEANIGRRVAFFNRPLVFYRENDYSDGRWEIAAERRNTQDLFNWTLGLCRLLSVMIREGVVDYRHVGVILELAQSGERYRLIDDILFKTYQQIEIWNAGRSTRQFFSPDELDEIISLLRRCDPTMFDPTAALKSGHQELMAVSSITERGVAGEQFRSRFLAAAKERQLSGKMISRFRGRLFGYEVYETPFEFVAIHSSQKDWVSSILEEVDPLGDGVDVLTASSLEEMSNVARRAAGLRLSRGGSDDSGVRRALSADGGEELSRLRTRAENAQKALDEMLDSTSWRLSMPIRVVGRALSALRRSSRSSR